MIFHLNSLGFDLKQSDNTCDAISFFSNRDIDANNYERT